MKRQDISETQILNPIYDEDTHTDLERLEGMETCNFEDFNSSRNKSFDQDTIPERRFKV
jgi:hypothetical protein